MTLAICIACGAEKFGAFIHCEDCGYTPATVGDKAKSIMLSDHNFPLQELRKFSQIIKAGHSVPYDPVALVMGADQILQEEYYWEHYDAERQTLPCIRCGNDFRSDTEALCPRCCTIFMGRCHSAGAA